MGVGEGRVGTQEKSREAAYSPWLSLRATAHPGSKQWNAVWPRAGPLPFLSFGFLTAAPRASLRGDDCCYLILSDSRKPVPFLCRMLGGELCRPWGHFW